MGWREAYQERIAARLKDINVKIAVMKVKAESVTAGLKEKYAA